MPPAVDPATISPTVLEEAATVMKQILEREPQLGDFGFGVFDQRRKSPDQCAAELRKERLDILDPRSLAAFVKAREWLRSQRKIQRINTKGSTYGLKHVAEKDVGYVTNGVFIAAAMAEGFRVQRIHQSPNAWLNISSEAWVRIYAR